MSSEATQSDGVEVSDLLRFIDESPSPYHAVATVDSRLSAAGFRRLDEAEPWTIAPGDRRYVIRGGTLCAFAVPERAVAETGFTIIGAHTDSPNLRIKPRPDTGRVGCRQLGVEVYGGALRNSWLDRDLGISGRVSVRGSGVPQTQLVRVDHPLLRVPQLAIHLDRNVNDGLVLNPQQHLTPVWGLGPPDEGAFAGFLAKELGVPQSDVLSFDVMVHDLTPSTLLGRDLELVSAPRIDNLLSCWAAMHTLLQAPVTSEASTIAVICLFDHEEIGSESSTGAASTVLPTVLERISVALGGSRDDHFRALARSACVSADGAHATHPNYPERHEPSHHIEMNGGPVIKINSNVRYATDATTSARFKVACEDAGVGYQEFVVRSDIACGSTIGPITAARLGIPIVDVGVAQLAMHSARELCGATDPSAFVAALSSFVRT